MWRVKRAMCQVNAAVSSAWASGWNKRLLGFAMLGGTLLLWVGSSVTVQTVFGKGEQFQQPVFVTFFNSAMSASLLLPRLAWLAWSGGIKGRTGRSGRRCNDLNEAEGLAEALASLLPVMQLSATVGLLWLSSQWVFNLSLLHTSVATNTVLSSTSSVFTFFFSLLICRNTFRWRSFGAAIFTFVGCALVTSETPSNLAKGAITNSAFGDGLALTSAAMFALASVLLRRLAPGDLDASSFIGMNGLLAMGLSPVVLLAAHSGGVESFRSPARGTLLLLAANALIGCALANYLYASALLLLSPFVASVCLSLSIPVSALFDEVLLRQHRFSRVWALGAALVVSGAVLAAVDLEDAETPAKAELEPFEASELCSLLGNQGSAEEESDMNVDFGDELSLSLGSLHRSQRLKTGVT